MPEECDRCGDLERDRALIDHDKYGVVCVPCLDYLQHET